MRGLPDFNPIDRKFWPDKPDPGFSPDKNKFVIESTIMKYEAMRAKKVKEFNEGVAERANAAACYLTSEHGARSSTPIQRYFGKRTLAKLQGKSIINKLKTVGSQNPSALRRRVWEEEGIYLSGKKSEKSKKGF